MPLSIKRPIPFTLEEFINVFAVISKKEKVSHSPQLSVMSSSPSSESQQTGQTDVHAASLIDSQRSGSCDLQQQKNSGTLTPSPCYAFMSDREAEVQEVDLIHAARNQIVIPNLILCYLFIHLSIHLFIYYLIGPKSN